MNVCFRNEVVEIGFPESIGIRRPYQFPQHLVDHSRRVYFLKQKHVTLRYEPIAQVGTPDYKRTAIGKNYAFSFCSNKSNLLRCCRGSTYENQTEHEESAGGGNRFSNEHSGNRFSNKHNVYS